MSPLAYVNVNRSLYAKKYISLRFCFIKSFEAYLRINDILLQSGTTATLYHKNVFYFYI